MSGGHHCAVVFIIKCSQPKVNQSDIGVLYHTHVLFLNMSRLGNHILNYHLWYHWLCIYQGVFMASLQVSTEHRTYSSLVNCVFPPYPSCIEVDVVVWTGEEDVLWFEMCVCQSCAMEVCGRRVVVMCWSPRSHFILFSHPPISFPLIPSTLPPCPTLPSPLSDWTNTQLKVPYILQPWWAGMKYV